MIEQDACLGAAPLRLRSAHSAPRRSTSARWVSVPPDTGRSPSAAGPSTRVLALSAAAAA
ncbi:hypothetical protein OHB01_19875 [Microbispora hainanensis]|nr:hypothetical protein [Microbispora hainanensis]